MSATHSERSRPAIGGAAPGVTTVVVVAYGQPSLDVSWVPAGTPVVVVHNDDRLVDVRCVSGALTHVRPGGNLGFAGGVNAALRHVDTERVLLANPDTALTSEQWALLDGGDPDSVVTVPQHDGSLAPNSVVNRYPAPLGLLAQAWRLGRWCPRGSRRRALAARLLGRQGRAHVELLTAPRDGRAEQVLPLAEYWVSGSLLALDVERLRRVGGLSERYFLYWEDVDLCRRLAAAFPGMQVRLRWRAGSALHSVGGSVGAAGVTHVRRIRRRSAVAYCRATPGPVWSACAWLLAPTSARRRS